MVMHQERNVKAHEWLERGKQAADPVDVFSCFWRAFNNLYYSVCGEQEREKIKLYLRNNIDEATA